MKNSAFLLMILLMTSTSGFAANSAAPNNSIYGWDVKCVGEKGLVAHAHQSDDDFYIDYAGAELKEASVWASGLNIDLGDNLLLFVTDQNVSKGPNVALAVDRQNVKGPGYAKGALNIEGSQFPVNCYVRYGEDEDKYDSISKKSFPPIAPPKSQK